MPKEDETNNLKLSDLFDTQNMLSGRTEIENISKLNVGLVWSCTGQGFRPVVSTTAFSLQGDSGSALNTGTDNSYYLKDTHLPNGATITGAIVYGATATWALMREPLNSTSVANQEVLASGNLGTENTTISNATVNNLTYKYYFLVGNQDDSFDIGDDINGARIVYTI